MTALGYDAYLPLHIARMTLWVMFWRPLALLSLAIWTVTWLTVAVCTGSVVAAVIAIGVAVTLRLEARNTIEETAP